MALYLPHLLSIGSLPGWGGTVLADMIAPIFPWFGDVRPDAMLLLPLPATLLAAVLERPFVAWAGVRRKTVWYSIQANLFSMILGYIVPVIGMILASTLVLVPLAALLLITAPVVVSTLSEGWYYKWRNATADRPLKWFPIIVGNTFSALVLVALVPLSQWILRLRPDLHDSMLPYVSTLEAIGVIVSLAAFAASFLLTLSGREEAAPEGTQDSAAEPVPSDSPP